MKITILGARGSIPTEGKGMSAFGGATSCVMVEAGENVIVLDAGTGITGVNDVGVRSVSVLITHPHVDHILGLPFFSCMLEKNRRIDIYATVKDGIGAYGQISSLISTPLWPCTADDYPADVCCHDITGPFIIGDVGIDLTESCHPGGSTIFRIEHDGMSFVYATDYEHSDEGDERLADFCRGTDLLLYDGQYTKEEYDSKRGYGHSTPEHGVYIMKKSNAHMMRIVHHDPCHDDEMLERMEKEIKNENTAFARQGEVIWLQR